MITRPTTLILGAGASQPFGFPTGSELRARILGLTRLNDTDSKNLLSIFGFNQDHQGRLRLIPFWNTAKNLAELGNTQLQLHSYQMKMKTNCLMSEI